MRSLIVLAAIYLVQACDSPNPPTAPVLTRIAISGGVPSVVLGAVPVLQLVATGFDQNNQVLPVVFTWTSSDATRASVDQTGLVTLLAAGSVTLTARAAGLSQSVVLAIVPPSPAPAVGFLILDDITNLGSPRDFEVSFDKVADESQLSEYRVVIVKRSGAPLFQLSTADALAPSRYLMVATTGQNQRLTLPPSTLDSDGDAVQQGIEYVAFVLSVANGIRAKGNGLSEPSNALRAEITTIKITFVGDMGVVLSDSTTSVAVDALPLDFTVTIGTQLINWVPAAPGLIEDIQIGRHPFGNVAIALVTHDHLDHWNAATSAGFVVSHPQASTVAPSQVTARMGALPRVQTLAPGLFGTAETTVNGVRIKAFQLTHFNNFGLDFSGVQNLAYLVELGGKKVLHLGDADFTAQNYAPFNFLMERIDVVIVPAATAKVTPASLAPVRSLIGARHIVASHLETNMSEGQLRAAWGSDVAVFTRSRQFLRY